MDNIRKLKTEIDKHLSTKSTNIRSMSSSNRNTREYFESNIRGSKIIFIFGLILFKLALDQFQIDLGMMLKKSQISQKIKKCCLMHFLIENSKIEKFLKKMFSDEFLQFLCFTLKFNSTTIITEIKKHAWLNTNSVVVPQVQVNLSDIVNVKLRALNLSTIEARFKEFKVSIRTLLSSNCNESISINSYEASQTVDELSKEFYVLPGKIHELFE